MFRERILKWPRIVGTTLWEAYGEWHRDGAARLSAALAYYTALSLAPMSILLVGLARYVFGDARWDADLAELLEGVLGPEVVTFVRSLLFTAGRAGTRYATTGIGIFAVVYGASRGLMCLRGALNRIFAHGSAQGRRGFLAELLAKALTIAVTVAILFGILLLLFLSPFLGALQANITDLVPALGRYEVVTTHVSSFLIATVFFMILYRVVPAHRLRWVDVLPGSLFTAVLFKAGDAIIRLYLRRTLLASLFGAAGSFVIVLLWLYFLAQIIFYGAEFTYVYLRRLGRISPHEEGAAADDALRDSPPR